MSKLLMTMKKIHLLIVIILPIIYLSIFSTKFENGEKTASDRLNALPIVSQYVKRYYMDQSGINPKTMLIRGLGKLERTLDEVLVDFPNGENGSSFRVQVMGDEKTFDLRGVSNLDGTADKMEEAFQFVLPRLVSKQVKVEDIEYSVLDEMLKTLDSHSGIIPPEVYKEFMIETEGSFGGLGIVIGIRDGQLTVIAPIEGTPAYLAGIKPNDKIVQIGDESTVNMSLIEAVGKLRGPKGTSIRIYVSREGLAESKEFSIVRDTIKIESVEHFRLADGIGYVRIRDFQKNTFDSLRESLGDLAKNGSTRGLILDLRGNPGGLLDQAERISDLFLESGTIVTTKVGDSKKPYDARQEAYEFRGKVVVLADSGTASASEIVAGALKNNDRAVLIGETTFGKGSVQQIFDISDDTALKLTIASYLTPGDISIQDTGITPDINLHPVIISKDEIHFNSSFGTEGDPEKANGQKKTAEKPAYSVNYLETLNLDSENEEEEQTPEEALSREEKRKKLENDFYTIVAREIILSSQSLSRKEMLAEVRTKIDQISESEEKKIEEKWKGLGIDWSSEETVSGAPKISVQIEPSVFKVKAGGKFSLSTEVENTGPVPLYRLTAVTKSENPAFNGKEFIFGKLAPGEKKTWSVVFEIPKWAFTREDEVTLIFKDAQERKIPDFNIVAQTDGLPRPAFAFDYDIADDGRLGSAGNGNGIPEAGETIALLIKVKNTGAGVSEKSILALKNLSGDKIFLKTGRGEFTNLSPGETKETGLTFNVKKSGLPIEMELAILDEVFRDGITSKITLDGKTPSSNVFEEPPHVNLFSPPLSTASVELNLKGLVSDKSGLNLVSVFVGEDKVILLPTSVTELPLSFKVKLKEGSNLITVFAKDSAGLYTKQSFVVRRGGEDKGLGKF